MAGRRSLGEDYAGLRRAEPGSRQELAYQVACIFSLSHKKAWAYSAFKLSNQHIWFARAGV